MPRAWVAWSPMPRIRAGSIEEHKVLTRRQILEAARMLLAETGNGDLNLGDLAAVAGIGRTTLYEYFTDRDDLIASLVEDALPGVIAGLVGRMDRTEEPRRAPPGSGRTRGGVRRYRPGPRSDPSSRGAQAREQRPGSHPARPHRPLGGDDGDVPEARLRRQVSAHRPGSGRPPDPGHDHVLRPGGDHGSGPPARGHEPN